MAESKIDRFKALGIFQNIEKDFPVHEWKIEGLDIWPIVRINLGYVIARNELWNNQKAAKKGRIKAKIERGFQILQSFLAKKPKYAKTDVFFLGSYTHDVDLLNRKFNRFFEPLSEGIKEHTSYFQYGNDGKSELNKRFFDQSFLCDSFYNKFLLGKSVKNAQGEWWKKWNSLPRVDDLHQIFQSELGKSKAVIQGLINQACYIYKLSLQYQKILKETSPKLVVVLNFYGPAGLACIHAAKQLGIKTVDMQHGPQTEGNFAYTAWKNLPKNGFNVLPDIFWVWDKDSKEGVVEWARGSKHKAVLGGNPWLEYWKSRINYDNNENNILYALQPLEIHELFPEYLLKFIEEETGYKWILRYHPRQSPIQVAEIEEMLKKRNLLDRISIEDAISIPLPLSLSKSKINVTNFSGTVIEAADLGIPSIILHPTGARVFEKLIKKGDAIFLETKETLGDIVKNLCKKTRNKPSENSSLGINTLSELIHHSA